MSKDRILGSGTLSYQDIVLSTRDGIIRLNLKRHLAPRTVRIILASLPIRGRAHISDNMTYVNMDIKSGLERGRTEFKRGDVAFMPGQCCICFVTGPYSTKRAMTPIGIMDGNIDMLTTIGSDNTVDIYEETG